MLKCDKAGTRYNFTWMHDAAKRTNYTATPKRAYTATVLTDHIQFAAGQKILAKAKVKRPQEITAYEPVAFLTNGKCVTHVGINANCPAMEPRVSQHCINYGIGMSSEYFRGGWTSVESANVNEQWPVALSDFTALCVAASGKPCMFDLVVYWPMDEYTPIHVRREMVDRHHGIIHVEMSTNNSALNSSYPSGVYPAPSAPYLYPTLPATGESNEVWKPEICETDS